jgi:hypothetical protein
MSALILNRESFSLPEDGWYQVAPLGVFPHAASGVVQIVDEESCEAMAHAFQRDSTSDNFAGLLIDFDHFSLDVGSKSEAAGWITGLEARNNGLWAQIRWSDTGEAAVRGGRYRFLSPVWSRADCVDLGENQVRPVRLLNAAVTNDPNLKGLVPLSNRSGNPQPPEAATLANAGGEKRLKWVLGNSPEDRHCPSCSALAGLVLPQSTWENAGLAPKSGRLFCGEHCHCRLVETDEPVRGNLGGVTALYGGHAANSSANADNRERALRLVREAKDSLRNNWSDEAREASIEVRKASARKPDLDDNETSEEKIVKELNRIREKLRKGEKLTSRERDFLNKHRPRRSRG